MKKTLLFIALFSIFILIYLLNIQYPLLYDDWQYSYIFGSDDLRISSLSDVVASQYNHYLTWGGRTVVHAIAQILLMLDFSWMCVINALIFAMFTFLLYRLGNKGNKANPILFIFIYLLIWFFQPAFFATVLWKTGSANYLWGALIVVLFMYPFYSYYHKRKPETGWIKLFLFFIGGIIAGWTNENMSVALVFFVIVSLFLFRYEKITIPNWAISGLVGVLIGSAFLLLAPGNYIRQALIENIYLEEKGFTRYDLAIAVLKDMWKYLRRYILFLSGIYVILLFVYNKFHKDPSVKKIVVRGSLLFFLTGVVAFVVMIASPSFPDRALFGILTMFIISIGILCANIDFSIKYLKIASILTVVTLTSIFGFRYYSAYKSLEYVTDIFHEREIYVEKQKELGVDSIVFTKTFNIRSRYAIQDLSADPKSWENVSYARFYGIKSVRVEADDVQEMN